MTGNNLRSAGEDLHAGDLLVHGGRRLGPAEIALLATQGLATLELGRRPRVAFLATGNELVPVGEALGPGRIHNSNGPLVCAQIGGEGYPTLDLGVAQDTPDALGEALAAALADCDLLVTSGGISAGRYDLVGDALVALGAEWHFHKIAQQPGKPLAFMTWRGKPVFCLPGNPVSTLVSTWYYVLPALRRMEGDAAPEPPQGEARLTAPIKGRPGKFFFGRAHTRWEGGEMLTEPRPPHGSHILGSLSRSNSFILLPPGTGELAEGSSVAVAFFRRGFETLA
jgi:molybdopterin molybdotransferase